MRPFIYFGFGWIITTAFTAPLFAAHKMDELLEMSLESLVDVKVTAASKCEEHQSDAPGIVSVITRDDLERFGGTTLRDVLERVASIYSVKGFLARSAISIRGDQTTEASSHVLVLINGRPTRERVYGGTDGDIYEAFPLNAIDHIEVIRGPGSVLYGTNGFSGVINIVTRNETANAATVDGLITENSGIGLNFSWNYNHDELTVFSAMRYMDKPDWEFRYGTGLQGLSGYFDLQQKDSSLGAFFDVRYKHWRANIAFTEWETNILAPGLNDPVSYSRTFADIEYSHQINDQWSSSYNLTLTQLDQDTFVSRDSFEALLEWSNRVVLNDHTNLVIGGVYTYIDGQEAAGPLQQPQQISMDANESASQIYGQIDFHPVDALKLITGLQYNKAEKHSGDLLPRLGAIYSFDKPFTLKLLYSEAYRAPSLDEMFLSDPRVVGAPDLEPETVETVDLSLLFNGHKSEASITYFLSEQNNLINRGSVEAEDGRSTFVNINELEIQGLELEGKLYAVSGFMFTGSATYQESKSETGKDVTPVPNLMAKLGVSYDTPNGFSLSLFDVYNGSVNEDVWPQVEYNPQYDAHHLLTLHIDYTFEFSSDQHKGEPLQLYLHVDNLLDEEVWGHDWIRDSSSSSLPIKSGRFVYVGAKVNF